MTIEVNFTEKDIEDFLCEDNNLQNLFGLKLIKRQFKIFDFYIDIFAYSKWEHCFYIIELKKDNLNSKAFTQLIKYMRLIQDKYNLPFKNHKFRGFLIGRELDEDLHYIVEFYDKNRIPNSNIIKYNLFNFTLKDGISFNWFNKAQREIKLKIDSEYYKNLEENNK